MASQIRTNHLPFFLLHNVLFIFWLSTSMGWSDELPVFSQTLYTTEAFILELNGSILELDRTIYERGGLEFMISVAGMPDLPPWMYLKQSADGSDNGTNGYLYGSPPKGVEGNLSLDVVVFVTETFDTHRRRIDLNILPRAEMASHMVEFKLRNLNIEDIVLEQSREKILLVFRRDLWRGDENLYLTLVASPLDLGGRLPLNPSDKEGVMIQVGGMGPFSRELTELEREIRIIATRQPCPVRYKATLVEHFFRDQGLIPDWCSFRLITISQSLDTS